MTRCLIAATLVAIGAVRCLALDVSILDEGAKPGGDALCTDAIQGAVDRASAAGGGRVTIPAGVFKSGALVLKAGVELHLAEGAVLLGSTDLDDYPTQMTRIEGHFEPWRPALVNAKDLDGVRITGPGTLDGNGKPFWTAFWRRRAENPKCTNLEVERPRLVFLENCTNLEVRDVRLKDSGFWNLHLYRCRDALVEGISIAAPHGDPPKIVGELQPWDETAIDRAPSSDGIDVDSCQNVTIRNCTISVGDDCIALKGTKGPLAMEDETSPPVENVLIEDCNFVSGHGVLTCGSEATIVRNVTLRNCRVGAAVPVVRLKLRPDTPQLYENIAVDGITADRAQAIFDVKPWTQFFDLQGHAPPQSVVRNVTVEHVTGTFRTLGELRGNKGDEISGVMLRRIDVVADVPRLVLDDEQAVVFQQVLVNGQPYSAVSAAASSSR
ncbi:MAG: right-handed parallel beta-helix repeat-containing protein [Pirellulales bacterium]|nr:right-handed parallel beta-helix repeat-containing protein [Pirellulales bacterium]